MLVWPYLLIPIILRVLGGTLPQDSPCNPSNDRIDPTTHKFTSDCDERTFCALMNSTSNAKRDSNSNSTTSTSDTSPSSTTLGGICTRRLCRNDEFPFGYDAGEPLPPLCREGYFCPDRGNGCQVLQSIGSACDMDRDYQCTTAKGWTSLSSELNFNGSICLKSICTVANVTVGLPCSVERTTYNGYNRENGIYNVSVLRDNCLTVWPSLYCGSSSLCERMKPYGVPCDVDRECLTGYCNAGYCDVMPGLPTEVKSWQYAVTILSVLGSVVMTCVFLALSHKRHRMERYYEVLEYYNEQTSLRASIINLHEAAAQRLENEKSEDLLLSS